MKSITPLLLCSSFFLTGCGPNLHALVQAKHYREAICAANDGGLEERSLVGNALDKDAELQLHMHVVTRAELEPVLDNATQSVIDRGRLVRVNVQSNILPIDSLDLNGSFVTDDEHVAGLVANWSTLAWLTQETLPPRRVEQTYWTGENVLKTGAAIFTVGLSLLFTRFQPGNMEVDAPLSEYRRMAPRAYALHLTTEQSGCSNMTLTEGVGRRCKWFFVLDNMSKSPVSFDVSARYGSLRKTGKPYAQDEDKCYVQRRFRIPLGPPSNIEGATQQRFGEKMVSVRSASPSK